VLDQVISSMDDIKLEEKMQLLDHYKRGGDIRDLLDMEEEGEEGESVIIDGKRYVRVELTGMPGEYLQGEDNMIYD